MRRGAHTQAPPASSPRQLSILIANETEARLDVTIDGRPEELKNALDITLRRFAEFTNLQGALGAARPSSRRRGS